MNADDQIASQLMFDNSIDACAAADRIDSVIRHADLSGEHKFYLNLALTYIDRVVQRAV